MNEMKFDKGLMAGSSTLLVLSLLESGDMYGYQMIEELARRSNDTFQMKEGTLYPILHALEQGQVSDLLPTGGPHGTAAEVLPPDQAGTGTAGRQKGGVEELSSGRQRRAVRRGQRPGAGVRGTAMKKSAFRLTRGQRTVRNVVIFLLAVAVWVALPKIPLWIIEGQIRAEAGGMEWSGSRCCGREP